MQTRVGIIGLGLMGGSMGLALKKYCPEIERWGQDANSEHQNYALQKNIIEYSLEPEHYSQMDFIFIAVPVEVTEKVIKSLYSRVDKQTVVTDMGSTKHHVCSLVAEKFPELQFVGGHPMAGREKSGPRFARTDLFQQRTYVLTPDQKQQTATMELKKLKKILSKIGSNVCFLSPETHDKIVALTSHLPHLLTTSLLAHFQNQEKNSSSEVLEKMVGSGFLDLTRIAASNSRIWRDIFFTNRENLIQQIEQYRTLLEEMKQLLAANKREEVLSILNKTREKRLELERKIGNGADD